MEVRLKVIRWSGWALVCLVRLREALCCEVQTTSRGTVAAVVCGLEVRRAAIVDLQRQQFAQADVKS
jgi:hypothetical protein